MLTFAVFVILEIDWEKSHCTHHNQEYYFIYKQVAIERVQIKQLNIQFFIKVCKRGAHKIKIEEVIIIILGTENTYSWIARVSLKVIIFG